MVLTSYLLCIIHVVQVAADAVASDKMRSEREKEELLGTAEVEKAEIREEVRLLLEQERDKAREEQESLRAQMVLQAAQSQEREVALNELYLEISRLKAEKAATVAAAEAERAKVVERRAEVAAAAAVAAVKVAAAASAAAAAAKAAAVSSAAAAVVEAERIREETRVKEIEQAAAEVIRVQEEAAIAEQSRILLAAAALKEKEERAEKKAVTPVRGLTKLEVDWLTDAGVPMSPQGKMDSHAKKALCDSLAEERTVKAIKNGQGHGNGNSNSNGSAPNHFTETDSTARTYLGDPVEGSRHILSVSESKMFHSDNNLSPKEAAGFFKMASATDLLKSDCDNGSTER